MYDDELQVILDDDDWWISNDQSFSTLDLTCTLDGTVVKCDRGELDEDNVSDWAQRKGPRTRGDGEALYHLKLLMIPSDGQHEHTWTKLLARKETYETLVAAWKLPSWTPRFFSGSRGTGGAMPFGKLMPTRTNETTYGIAVKNIESHRMAAIYDPGTRTTSILVCSDSSSADLSVSELIDRIEKSSEHGCFPILAPFLLLEGLEKELSDIQTGQRNRIQAVERRTDFYAFSDDESDDEGNDGGIDLVDYTREYTKIHALSRALEMDVDDAQQGIMLLQNMHKLWLEQLPPKDQGKALSRWHELSERLLLTEKFLRKNSFYIKGDQSGIQLSIQTIYALIGTNDSHLNYETAQASLRIAEDSRKVAVLTRYDSTDMRVIAGTTLLFLPATFVATLFSTDFFNFKPSGDGLVSSWVWIYFAVSAILTVAVMAAWRLLSFQREKETEKLLDSPTYEGDELGRIKVRKDGKGDVVEGKRSEESSATTGISFDEIKNRLSKRKKTRTMEMEEAKPGDEKSS